MTYSKSRACRQANLRSSCNVPRFPMQSHTPWTLSTGPPEQKESLSPDMECPLPLICADPTRIRQILIILVDNAIKFTPANGTVTVRARILEEDPNRLLLEVSDSGCGISPDMTERIFERLFQASDLAVAG